MKLSLSSKVILLVSIAVVFEIGFFSTLVYLHEQAEAEAAHVTRAKRISDAVDILAFTTAMFSPTYISEMDVEDLSRYWSAQFQVLKQEFAQEPKKLSVVKQAEKDALEGVAILEKLRRSGSHQVDEEQRRLWLFELDHCAKNIMSGPFVGLKRHEANVLQKGDGKATRIRDLERLVLIVGVLLNVIVSICIAIVLVKWLTMPLKLVSENAHRLAAGEPLNPELTGTDEIATVDRMFHSMADALNESAKKERAIVENARDVICSIDSDGKFTAVNSAASEIFQFDSGELLGRRFITLIAADDVDHVLSEIEKVTTDSGNTSFESRVIRRDGAVLDTLWSVHFSKAEKSLFCVIHDDSARKQVDRMKQEVVAMVTHDLRSPVASVRNFLEMLETDILGDLNDRGKKLLQAADKSTLRMLGLINDLLDIEKIKSGMFELELEKVSINSILESSCQALMPHAAASQIAIEVKPADQIVNADEERIARVVTNLVNNSLKFSPAGTTITVSTRSDNGFAVVSVCDRGRGIPNELIPNIFDRFTQASSSDARQSGGSGLGLAICNAIVELHGGKIWVESAVGEGTTFSFTLPLSS